MGVAVGGVAGLAGLAGRGLAGLGGLGGLGGLHAAGPGRRTVPRRRLMRKHYISRFLEVSDDCASNLRRHEIFVFCLKKI